MQCIYNTIFTCVYKVSLQRKNKPAMKCAWISDLSVNNQKQMYQNTNHMDSDPQCQKRIQPSLFNQLEPRTKKLNFSGVI